MSRVTMYVQQQLRQQRAKQAERMTLLTDQLKQTFKLQNWLRGREFVPRFLVCVTLLTAAWVVRRGASAEWWGPHGPPSVGLLSRWGPFRLAEDRIVDRGENHRTPPLRDTGPFSYAARFDCGSPFLRRCGFE